MTDVCRYLSTCEACWRTFAYDIHVREPYIERLAVHLPKTNRVIYSESENLADVVGDPKKYKTMLTEWFVANQRYRDARNLTYIDFPSKWIWNWQAKKWKRRKIEKKRLIGQIYNVHPTTNELFFLRMLLTVVPGARNFEDLRT
jgi:hypothetical protein